MNQLNTQLTRMPMLDPHQPNKSTGLLNGASSGILNWNDIRYPVIYERYKELLGNFWTPFEINMSDDIKQWKTFSEESKDVFLKINGLISILDSVQPRFFGMLSKYVTDPSIQSLFTIAMQQEIVHNHSYSYIMSSIESVENQNRAFDMARSEKVIYERNKLITDIYEAMEDNPTIENFVNALVASLVLEGINFYSAFAYFYNLARNQKMVKTSTMISYINKDELVHTKLVADVLNLIIEENPSVKDHAVSFAKDFLRMAVDKEIEWSSYILANEEDIDLYEMCNYIKYRANKCLSLLGVEPLYPEVGPNPMPWIRVFDEANIDLGKTDFFENRPRAYTKVGEDNGFDEL